MPTQTAVEGDAVMQTDIRVEDCRFRMLMADEVKLGMAFAPGYVLLGTSSRRQREDVRQRGHPAGPRDIIACVVEAVTGTSNQRTSAPIGRGYAPEPRRRPSDRRATPRRSANGHEFR
ncbi:hypothetical protein [Pseudonocardia sp. UM4_GMWB1]|uniref:hypothetical protein n=1 Tax=Pseudonocardia sp. UM4_GMWB1 TaxID=2212989 RepID=UPI00307D0EF1